MSDGGKLVALVRPASEQKGKSPSVVVRQVAFSPKGTILATGNGEGEITVRLSDGGGQVLRLAHEGPILKLGFSPNGRVLAALGKPQGNKSEARQGIIRLWVTKNWDQTVKNPIGTRPAAAVMPPEESGKRGR